MHTHDCAETGCHDIAPLLAELARAELDGTADPSQVMIGPYSAFVMISALQLAWRHPDLPDHMRDTIEATARQFQVLFGEPLAGYIELGWDISQDVPATAGGD